MLGILYTIAVILIIIWLCSFVFHLFLAGVGFGIHALLVIAIILIVIGLLRGRTAAP